MSEQSLKQKTKKGLYWQFLNQFSNYGIQFIIGIFMARLLTPEDYGITALPAVFISIASIFIDCGFGGAIIRKPDLKEEDISTAFYYSACVGAICYVLLFFSAPYIASFYDVPILDNIIKVTSLTFLIAPLNTPQGIILNRKLDFKTPTKIGVISKIIMGICGIVLAYTGYGVWAIVLSNLISSIINLILTWYVVRWYPKTGWSKESFSYLWNYGNKMLASFLFSRIYDNIVPIFIGKYYSPAALGEYNRAQNYASLPSSQATGVLQTVTFPVLSKIQNDDKLLRDSYRRILKLSVFVVFPIMMLLSAIARPLIILMITDKWEGCILLLQLICFSLMWYPVHAINLNLLQVKGRTDYFLKLEVIKRIFGIAVLCVTLPISLVAMVLGGWVSSAFSLIVNTYYTGKILKLGFVEQLHDYMPSLLLSLFMYGCVCTVNIFVEGNLLQIIIGGIVGTLVYIGGSLLFKFSELEDLKYFINIKK